MDQKLGTTENYSDKRVKDINAGDLDADFKALIKVVVEQIGKRQFFSFF